MKTTKNYTALSLVLIFAAVLSFSASATGKVTRDGLVYRGIHHQVNVTLSIDRPLCNMYLIEVRDGRGQLVAPAQRFIPGKTKYDFTERGPASGIRVASLVRDEFGDHFICENELFTTPDFVVGSFLVGQTYRYDLFPATQPNKD